MVKSKKFTLRFDDKFLNLISKILNDDGSIFESEAEVVRKACIHGLKEFEKQLNEG